MPDLRARRSTRHVLAACVALAAACGKPATNDSPAAEGGPAPAKDETPAPGATPSGGPSATPDTSVVAADGPLATLRTGTLTPTAMDAIEGAIEHVSSGDGDFYELALKLPADRSRTALRAAIDDAPTNAIVLLRNDPDTLRVWMYRPIPSKMLSTSFTGTVWFEGYEDGARRIYAAPLKATGTPKKDDEVRRRFADALSIQLRDRAATPFHHFAAGRIHAAVLGKGAKATAAVVEAGRALRTSTDLSQLMYTTTAATSLQEALQYEKGLGIASDDGKRNVALSELKTPALADHPFEAMRAGLSTTTAPTPEPLAAAVPADFWYLRFSDIRDMLRVLDEASTWMTPVAHAMEERPLVRDLADRYQRELGLGRSGLAKALGHTAVSRLAVTGSDPYLRDGSDVTFVFEIASQSIFDSELERHMTAWQSKVEGIAKTELVHNGRVITVHTDPRGLVRQHRAQIDQLAVVSNSAEACKRVIDAIEGRAPRLSDEKDLQYMLARDPGEHDAFAFIGDRFVAAVVGPQQKVQQARRMRAGAELASPGYAALLFGWLEGRAPASTKEMIDLGVLRSEELAHADGTAIEFTPGLAARSSWGRTDALTPRIDLPAVEKVTEAERQAYDRFAQEYQDYWRQFIDPIAVRLDFDGDKATVDVRVLPLIEGTNYRDIEQVVGKQRIDVPAISDGLQAVWAVGKDTELRRDLDRMSASFSGKAELGIGWLGDWVMLGTLDRSTLTGALAAFEDRVQMPPPPVKDNDERELAMAQALGKLPVFAVADIDNTVALVAALTALRAVTNEVAPGTVTWENVATYKDVAIVRIGVAATAEEDMRRFSEAIAIYYAQAGGAIVFALQQSVVEALIDRLDDATTRPKGVDTDGTQFAIEGHVKQGGGAWTALVWALQGQSQVGQPFARSFAEAILRGDPATAKDPAKLHALSLAYFGGVPVTAEGRTDWTLGPEGVGDPMHGTEITPIYPSLPIDASTPIGELMKRLSSVRATIAFDDEPTSAKPPVRSLHTRFELTLGAEAG
jgi:hypothetical protein